jgi:hypothetical protein
MADRTTSSTTIGAGRAEVMAVIADFPAYPQWAGSIKSAEVVSTGPDGRADQVRFVLDAGVRWQVVEPGKMVGDLRGSYQLAETGRGTDVTYELTVDLTVPMIGMIKRKAEKVIVDTALKGLKKRVEGRST